MSEVARVLFFRPTTAHAAVAWIAAAATWLGCEGVAASAAPGYTRNHFISDLGVPEVSEFADRLVDSPLAWVMNAGFVGHGVLFAVAAVVMCRCLPATRERTIFLACALLHAVGIMVVGAVPGSPRNTDNGLIVVHLVGAVLATIGGELALLLLSQRILSAHLPSRTRVATGLAAVGGAVSLVVLALDLALRGNVPGGYGVWERGAAYATLVAELLLAIALLSARRVGGPPVSSSTLRGSTSA